MGDECYVTPTFSPVLLLKTSPGFDYGLCQHQSIRPSINLFRLIKWAPKQPSKLTGGLAEKPLIQYLLYQASKLKHSIGLQNLATLDAGGQDEGRRCECSALQRSPRIALLGDKMRGCERELVGYRLKFVAPFPIVSAKVQ